MYIPSTFAVADQQQLHDFIQQHSFGILISHSPEGPLASHLPFLLQRDAGPHGTLIGHVARANPHWRLFDTRNSLAIFSGPHAYISPTWYAAEAVVPTWNYIAVHAYGHPVPIEDPVELDEIVRRMVDIYESSFPQPWKLEAGTDFVDKLLGQIVGFRMEITRIEGKWKLNQNQPIERRERVIAALSQRNDEQSQAIAAAMRDSLRNSPSR